MRISKKTWLPLFFLTGFATIGNASAESPDSIREAVIERRAAAIAAYNAGDADAMVSHYTEDTWHISPRRPPVQGRAALRDYFAPAMKSYLMSTDNDILNVDVDGDTATVITRSTLTGSPRPGVQAPSFTEERLNLSVFKRQANGDWLIHRFIDTTPAAPARQGE